MRDGLVDGRFRLLQPLGKGPRGEVWQAVDEHADQRPVAVKLFGGPSRPDQPVRIDNPYVIRTFFGGTDDGVPYAVMELVDGVSLATVLEEGPLHGDDAKTIAAGVALALHAAHAGGFAHGNLKASNVLIGEHGAVKVGDFAGHGDPREDMYALGLLMEAMAGRRDKVVERLLSREPHSPAELYEVLTGQPLREAGTDGEEEPERPKLLRLAVITGLVTLVIVIAGCVWFLLPSSGPQIESQDPPPPGSEASQPSRQPSAGPEETPQEQVTTGAPAVAGTGVSAVKAVIANQLKAGQIQADAAAALSAKLDEVGRFLSRGQTKQANDRIDTLKAQLSAQRQANAVTADAYNAILAAVNKLT